MKVYSFVVDFGKMFWNTMQGFYSFVEREFHIPIVNLDFSIGEALLGGTLFVILGYGVIKFFTDIVL